MEYLFISDLETEMRRQLVYDMAAQLRLGKPLHSAKGCIKFREPLIWMSCPIIQIDFCLIKEQPILTQMILWLGRRPDEDDFFSHVWLIDTWDNILADAEKICFDRKEADDE